MPMMTPEVLLLLIGVFLLLGILATKLSPYLGAAVLALFMLAGMVAGPEGPGRIARPDPALAHLIGTVGLIGILFSSGICTRWDGVSPVLRPSLALAVLGPLLAGGAVAVTVHFTSGVPWAVGALLGAAVAASDPVAPGSLFRSRRVRSDPRTMELLGFESVGGAAMAAFLAVVILRWASGQETLWWRVVLRFLTSAALGAVLGLLLGFLTVWVLNRLRPGAEILYTLLTAAAALIIYSLTALLHGSGFLAVFISAVVIGNSDMPDRGPVRRFHEGLPWISQIALFVLLGILVPPSAFVRAIGVGLAVSAAVLLAARPLAVGLALAGSPFPPARRFFISWVGQKGAVPVALATFAFARGIQEADWILSVVAMVVVVSSCVHGLAVPWLAGVLRVRAPAEPESPEPLDMVDLGPGGVACFRIDEASPAAGCAISDLGLPENCLLILVTRQGQRVRPRGSTVLNAGDEVYAYSPRELFPVLQIRLMGDRP